MSGPESPTSRQSGLLYTLRAVLWGFLGVRRKSDYQQDLVKLNPLHLVLVGVLVAFAFVAGLMLLVRWVVA
ncbi:DUF2970 domain-containing protein [Hydrogenophaga defluvii]|uniref:DUF2970 domain-containing protein n=1 Tax=Hydrogenophaga defluvii TaxID=249410 RepID=A0ABW2SH94_9BURK